MALTVVDGAMLNTANAQYTMFKNRLINGGFGIWQRGTSGFASGAYTADRWAAFNITSASRSTDVPSGFQYSIEFANTSASFPLVRQNIESVNCTDLVGQTVTVSYWAKNISGSAVVYSELYYANSTDNFGAVTYIGTFQASAASPSSSWTYYTGTITNLPAGAANGLQLNVVRTNGSAATTRVTGVQLEKGSNATSFDYRPYTTELQLCQRYAWKWSPGGVYNMISTGYASATTSVFVPIQFPVTMRTSPTFTNAGNWRVCSNSCLTVSAFTGSSSGVNSYFMACTVTGATAGYSYALGDNSDTTAYMLFSAEL